MVALIMKPWKKIRGTCRCRAGAPARFALILAVALVFLTSVPAFAQSCALCYTQAASSGSRMIQALRSGILILIAPPTFMTAAVLFICYRKRHQTRDESHTESDRDWKHPEWKQANSWD